MSVLEATTPITESSLRDQEELSISIEGMTCASCVRRVERALARVENVGAATVNLATETATVGGAASPAALVAAVERAGYRARVAEDGSSEADADAEDARHGRRLLIEIAAGVCLSAPVAVLSMFFPRAIPSESWLLLALALPVWAYVGRSFHWNALAGVRHGSLNMDTLVSLGSSAAFLYSVWVTIFQPSSSTYFDTAAVIVTLILVGRYLESKTRRQAGSAIRRLAGLSAKFATVMVGDEEVEVPLSHVVVGDILRIRPGAKVPTDGQVIEGHAGVDESMISGESMPVDRGPGDEVIGSTIALDGALTIRATRVGRDTALAQIIRLVERAQSEKAPVQRLADEVSQYFVPAILAIAVITLAGWMASGHSFASAMTVAVAVVVVACPCALGLATPTAIMVASGRGAENGILIRGGESLERMRSVNSVLLDKTGTITLGKPAVTDVVPFEASPTAQGRRSLLAMAAAAEQASEHPIGRAVVSLARAEGIQANPTVGSFKVFAGGGVEAVVNGATFLAGSPRLLAGQGISLEPHRGQVEALESKGRTVVMVAEDGTAVGALGLTDAVKEGSREAIQELHEEGIELTMATGDNRQAAASIAEEVGIDRVLAGVGPADKAEEVRRLQRAGRVVAVAGDGINDAPALAQADAGIAMGTGTDVAMETAAITLVKGDLRSLPLAIRLSRSTMRTIRQNLFWALIYNLLLVPLAAFGVINPMLAAAAMALSSVTVVSNSLRLRGTRRATLTALAAFAAIVAVVASAIVLNFTS